MLVWHANLAISKPLSLAPGDVFGDAAALLLSQGGHDRNQQFALGIQRPDVLLLKENLHTAFLELAHRDQTVDSVAGEAADGLGDDQIYHANEIDTNKALNRPK